jgi:hypothetical protein
VAIEVYFQFEHAVFVEENVLFPFPLVTAK